MKKSNILLVFTHLVAVFMRIFVFYIVSNISENNTGAWYNGTTSAERSFFVAYFFV